jgi:hypothetical protein
MDTDNHIGCAIVNADSVSMDINAMMIRLLGAPLPMLPVLIFFV